MDERSLNDDPISEVLGLQQPCPRTCRSDLSGKRHTVGGGQGIGQRLNATGRKSLVGSAGQKGLAAVETILKDAQKSLFFTSEGGQTLMVHGPKQVPFAIQDCHQLALTGQKVVEQGSNIGFER